MFTDVTNRFENLARVCAPKPRPPPASHIAALDRPGFALTLRLPNEALSTLIRTTTFVSGGFSYVAPDIPGNRLADGDACLMPEGWSPMGSYRIGDGPRGTTEVISARFL